MRIYLDMCCVKRPFDDQTQVRIRLETEAVDALLALCRNGLHELISSEALEFENVRNPNEDRKAFASAILAMAQEKVMHSAEIAGRANDWVQYNVSLLDALHLASAEKAQAEVFVSTDDHLRHRAIRLKSSVRIVSPLELIQELST